MSAIIIIPARMASTRLPNKPLADIAGQPMIAHVLQRATRANCGQVVVACAEQEVAEAVESHGGTAILTDPNLPSGSDRIWQAYERLGKPKVDAIVNVQGDLPTLQPSILTDVVDCLHHSNADIATLGNAITSDTEWHDPNTVKIALALQNQQQGNALYFSRAPIPHGGTNNRWHHIGIYAYTPHALETFVNTPPSPLEQCEKLEQLRALEAGLRISCRIVNATPFGVDTKQDLEKARELLA